MQRDTSWAQDQRLTNQHAGPTDQHRSHACTTCAGLRGFRAASEQAQTTGLSSSFISHTAISHEPCEFASSLWLELLGVGEWNLPQADAVVEGLLCLRPQPAEDGAFDLYHVAPLSLSHHRVLGLVH